MNRILAALAAALMLSSLSEAQVYNGSTYKYGGHTYFWDVTAADANGNCNARCSDEAGYSTGWTLGTAGSPNAAGVPSVHDTTPAALTNVGNGEADPEGRKVDVSGGKSYSSTNGGAYLQMRPAVKEKGKGASLPATVGGPYLGWWQGDDIETVPERTSGR
jgi:hypothetical protein